MPENHNLEISIQQKMDLFRVEPDPADWRQIYEQLHPRKRRRFFFWIFPLAGALLVGSYLYTINRESNPAIKLNAVSENMASAQTPTTGVPKSGDINLTDPTTNNDQASKPNHEVDNQQADEAHVSNQPFATSDTTLTPVQPGSIARATPLTFEPAKGKPNSPSNQQITSIADKPAPLSKNSIGPDPSLMASPTVPQKMAKGTTGKLAVPDATSGVADSNAPSETSAAPKLDPETVDRSASINPSGTTQNDPAKNPKDFSTTTHRQQESNESTAMSKNLVASLDSTVKTPDGISEPATQARKNVPNTTTHKEKGWYLGGYAEIGSNKPTDPISMAKSYDLGNVLQGGNIYQTTSSRSAGIHYAFGVVVERKKKNFSMDFGLGIQQNTWSNGYTIYRDSILPNGALYSSTQVSSKQSNYKHTAFEIPVNVHFKLAGKKSSSLWLGAGWNNAITLGLRENSTSTFMGPATGLGNGVSDSVRTSDATPYQPQLRFSLMYEHTGKTNHWQVSPFLQYGLSAIVKQGQPDILMLHLGMQFRYYFKRLDGKH
jgi:hypothetical protein